MKNKKFILIAALAIAGWLLLRNKNSENAFSDQYAGSGSPNGGYGSTALNINSVDSILENLDFTPEERSFVKSFQNGVKASILRTEDIRNKASRNGVTFAKQVVMDALWVLYTGKDSDGNNY